MGIMGIYNNVYIYVVCRKYTVQYTYIPTAGMEKYLIWLPFLFLRIICIMWFLDYKYLY